MVRKIEIYKIRRAGETRLKAEYLAILGDGYFLIVRYYPEYSIADMFMSGSDPREFICDHFMRIYNSNTSTGIEELRRVKISSLPKTVKTLVRRAYADQKR